MSHLSLKVERRADLAKCSNKTVQLFTGLQRCHGSHLAQQLGPIKPEPTFRPDVVGMFSVLLRCVATTKKDWHADLMLVLVATM